MRPNRLIAWWMLVLWLTDLASPLAEARAQSAVAPPFWMPQPPPAGSQPTPTQPIPAFEPPPSRAAAPSNTPYLGWTPWIPTGWFPPYIMKGDLFGKDNHKAAILQPQL